MSSKSASATNSSWRDLPPYHSDFSPLPSKKEEEKEESATTTKQQQQQQQQQQHQTTVSSPSTTNDNNNNRIYSASCYCGRVKYQIRGDPLTSKICHCRGCQQLHGAPFEWVSIVSKENVRFYDPTSLDFLYFYNSELDQGYDAASASSGGAQNRVLPCKVSCSHCRSPIADEGRNMWLAYGTQFGFTSERGIPDAFQHSCHLFYQQRCIDLHKGNDDNKPKWVGHRNQSPKYEMNE